MGHPRLTALVLGLVSTLVCIELLVIGGQWAFVRLQEHRNRAALSGAEGEVRVLTIGESTTAVAGNAEGTLLIPHTAYPAQLATRLESRDPQRNWKVFNMGMMGGTTPAILETLEPALEEFDPHVVVAMMGIKDTPAQRMPDMEHVPWPLSELRTVDLFMRLREDRALRAAEVRTGIEHPEDLPEVLRPGRSQLRKYVREVRLEDGSPAIPELELATYLWFIQRHTRAIDILHQTIERYELGRILLARVHVTNAEPDAAFAVLEEGIRRHPDEAMLRVALVEALLEHGQPERAETVLDESRGQTWASGDFAQQELVLAEARIAHARSDEPQAQALLDSVDTGARPPTSHKWWIDLSTRVAVLRGSICLEQGDLPCAVKALEQAVQEAPGDHANMWLLSKAYRQSGRFDDEARVRRSLLTVKGRLAEYMELAKLFRQMGHNEQVGALFDEAVETIPSLRESHRRLYEITGERGIHLVVMQYPSFSLEDLHKYAPEAPHVSFVDNAQVFAADPDACFHEPGFPHSFSHYTAFGAGILADHVADHLLSLGVAPTTP